MTKHLGNTLLAVRPLLPAVALAGLLACNGTGGPRASHPRPATTVNETAVTTVPEPPASEPGALGDQLAALEAALRDPAAPQAGLPALGRAELLAYRRLAHHPDWLPVALARVPGATQEAVRRNLAAQLELEALTPPRTSPPPWQVGPPLAASDLLSFYREAEAATGVSWAYLAAIHFVETNMGRIHSPSTAGAVGPMQFLPATWAAYGHGDIHNDHDAIQAAARYLKANGAPAAMDRALFRYNPSQHYVRAVTAYAQVLLADERAYTGYYNWPVLVRLTSGEVIISETGVQIAV